MTGGVGDVVESSFGHRFSICDLEGAWTAEARKDYISRRLLATAMYRLIWPGPRQYTQVGFEVRPVPKDVWSRIEDFYGKATPESWVGGKLGLILSYFFLKKKYHKFYTCGSFVSTTYKQKSVCLAFSSATTFTRTMWSVRSRNGSARATLKQNMCKIKKKLAKY